MTYRLRRSARRPLLGGLALCLLSFACSDLLVEPASKEPASLSFSFAATPRLQVLGGLAAAIARADSARVRLETEEGKVLLLDRAVPLVVEGDGVRVRVPVTVAGELRDVALTVALEREKVALFRSSATVALAGGQTTRAELPLEPVIARVDAPDSLPTVTAIGDPVSLSAAALLATGDTIPDVELTWSSLDPAVVEVTDGGPVARAEGRARLVAGYGELADTTEVAVRAVVASIEVTPSPLSVQQNFEQRLTATTRDRNHNALTGRAVAWRSAAEGIATVDANGVVRGVAAGHATIVASSEGVEGVAEVTVTPPVGVTVAPTTAELLVGGTVQLRASVTRSGDARVTWSSSNAAVARVDASGLVTGAAPGTATVTATSVADPSASATATVKVLGLQPPTLTAAATGVDVELSWTGGGADAVSYRISRRRLDPEGAPLTAWATIATVATTSHRDATDQEDARFEYRVEACAADGTCSEPSNAATATTRPAAPAGLAVEVTRAATANEPTYDLRLSWEDRSSFEDAFRVEHAAGTPDAYAVLADVPTADGPVYDDARGPNSTHQYRVRACNAAGCSAPTGVASVTLDAIAALAETRPASEVTSSSAVLHGYIDPNDSGEYEQWFEIGIDPLPGNYQKVGRSTSSDPAAREWSTSLTDLGSSRTYYYRIVVRNAKGITYGAILSFTTDGEPTALLAPRMPLDRREPRVNDTGRPSAPPAHPSRGE
jgi:hypothetical protein